MNTEKFNLSTTSFNNEGSISLEEYRPGYWRYQSNNTGNALAVFSEIYYPKDFIVKVDGQETEMISANYILRALELTAGSHTIEFEFKPRQFKVGKTIMLISTILTLLIFFGGAYRVLFRQEEKA